MKISFHQKSFTLLEAMIAIFVITIGIIAVLQAFPLSIQVQKSAQMATIAAQLGQEKMEEIIAKSYADISSEATTTLSSPFQAYKRAVQVSELNPGIKKVIVIVYWKSPLGVTEKDLKIATLISKR